MSSRELILLGILLICVLNLARMSAYLLTSDIYAVKSARRRSRRRSWHLPPISVIVPAHNEEVTIERNLLSLYASNYPSSKLEVIVVNDGSTDRTRAVVEAFKRTHKDRCKFRLLNRPKKGKAAALNYALRRAARGRLVMCLDADSFLAPEALRNAAQYFRDRKVVALSSNVNVVEDGTLLTLIQRFEYLVCYQMKKGQALMGMEYIVGGIGSMFRRSMLEKVAFYDDNTMTEDIDLTMKIIVNKERGQKIAYASDCVAYTEAAHSLPSLLRQRFRWKYGRSQTFLKNSVLFFDRQGRFARRLSWLALPFALLQDMLFLFEPVVLGYFLYNSLRYGDVGVFTSATIVLTFYLLCNLWASDHLSIKARLRLTYYAPPMYLLMYVLSFAEYYALIKALVLMPRLRTSIAKHHTSWRSPERRKLATAPA